MTFVHFEYGAICAQLMDGVKEKEFMDAIVDCIKSNQSSGAREKLLQMIDSSQRDEFKFVISGLRFPESEYPLIFRQINGTNGLMLDVISTEALDNGGIPYVVCIINNEIKSPFM
ncbi:hypothetical protein MP638_001408 [Amoeboaphelidium occidentale]|nr:hypothetical protein MP638_001408 [Amoeboaphelidium occidentale]